MDQTPKTVKDRDRDREDGVGVGVLEIVGACYLPQRLPTRL